jgi:hypothetical protein
MKFTILVEAFLLYIYIHLVFLTHMQLQRRKKLVIPPPHFALPQRPQGGMSIEIYNLSPPPPHILRMHHAKFENKYGAVVIIPFIFF